MNERISKFADLCRSLHRDGNGQYVEQFDEEKFAELIIRECLEQVKDQYLPVKEDDIMMKDPKWIGYVHCGVDSVVAIKEHFGVEE